MPSTREATFKFESRQARVSLRLSASTDREVRKVILGYDLEIIPVLMRYDPHAEVEFPLDAVDKEAAAKWIDDRIVEFVRTYLSMGENEIYLKEYMVEDPVPTSGSRAWRRAPSWSGRARSSTSSARRRGASSRSRRGSGPSEPTGSTKESRPCWTRTTSIRRASTRSARCQWTPCRRQVCGRFRPGAGAYVLADAPDGKPDVLLLATGSEVALCLEAYERLKAEGIKARVVSMPSWELFDDQPQEYRDRVLPPDVTARVSVEQASTFGWARYVGATGTSIGMRSFGASAPLKDLVRSSASRLNMSWPRPRSSCSGRGDNSPDPTQGTTNDTHIRRRETEAREAGKAAAAGPLSAEELRKMDAYWRASNYLSVGQIYLLDNPLLKEPLKREHIKPRLLGHWGTSPGLNMLCVHLNRVIKRDDLNMIYIIGPGHGGPSLVAHAYLEGTYSEVYPNISQDAEGMKKLFKQFSFPGGIPSHVAPETPGSIHEGGELGYALSHAYGAAFDNPDLIVACVVGDGEAETGPLATGWHGNKFLNPARDGCVLPILHLNGYKIANPCFLARIPKDELQKFFEGMGYTPYFVEGHDPAAVHQQLADVLDTVVGGDQADLGRRPHATGA